MLKIEDASIAYEGLEIFSGLNMHVHRGEIACISGESGSGKTSLLNAIMGFVDLKEGRISVDDITLNESSIGQIRRKIAWIPQELALPCEWVSEMIKLPFDLKANRGVLFSKDNLFDVFKELNLETTLYDKRVSEVSGGQRQRMMIAVAALLDKSLLIIDEPTSALDKVSTERVLHFLRSITLNGTAVLAVSHDLTFKQGCDKTINL